LVVSCIRKPEFVSEYSIRKSTYATTRKTGIPQNKDKLIYIYSVGILSIKPSVSS